ncbi:hypothetical protein KEM48_011664 [Puccinia striiformis f. sp. tritici PST-130]|nr:hypothetical protein KEM48_011664 [Puccinia striiformis f. sp. tritici PST-130]
MQTKKIKYSSSQVSELKPFVSLYCWYHLGCLLPYRLGSKPIPTLLVQSSQWDHPGTVALPDFHGTELAILGNKPTGRIFSYSDDLPGTFCVVRSLRYAQLEQKTGWPTTSLLDYKSSFNEDGDSLSFGSIQTPPFLRDMVQDVLGGSLNAHYTPSNHASSVYGSQPEIFSQHAVPTPIMADHLNDGSNYCILISSEQLAPRVLCKCGDRVSASDRPLPVFNAHLLDNYTPPANPGPLFVPNTPPYTPGYDLAANLTGFARSSNNDDVYWLDPFPQTIRLDAGPFDKIPNPVHSTNPSEVDQLAGSTSSLSSGLGPLAPPNSRDPFVLNAPKDEIPSLFGVSSMIDDVSVASGGPPSSSFPDDPRDLTYSPPKAATARSKRRACSSNHRQTKPKFATTQARDARGRFKSASSIKRAPKASVVRSVVMETAMNPFQNTVGTSASGARPFVFDHPNPFDPSLTPAPVGALALSPTTLPPGLIDLPSDNPRVLFRASFQHLYGILGPLLAELSYPRENLPRVLEISQTLYEAQEWYLESVHFYPDVTGSVFWETPGQVQAKKNEEGFESD